MNAFDMRAAALSLVSLVSLGAAVSLGACGGEASVVSPKGPADDLSSADGALAALDHAESELGRALGAQPGFAQAPAASAAPVAPQQPGAQQAAPPPPPPMPTVPSAEMARRSAGRGAAKSSALPRDERKPEHEAPATQAEPCGTACSALASMERAADHLCGLAGARDARCEEARTRVRDAAARVRAACPSCAR